MRPESSSVAAYILRPNPADPSYEEARAWIASEHFPEQECSAVVTNTLPAGLPQDLIQHLSVGQMSVPGSVVMVVRPIKL